MHAPDSTTAGRRLDRARVSLEGLALGDAFGGAFFGRSDLVERLMATASAPGTGTWHSHGPRDLTV